MASRYRTGTKIKLNVYDGDRPMCQCHCEPDAVAIVLALNCLANTGMAPDEANAPIDKKPEASRQAGEYDVAPVSAERMRQIAGKTTTQADCSFGIVR